MRPKSGADREERRKWKRVHVQAEDHEPALPQGSSLLRTLPYSADPGDVGGLFARALHRLVLRYGILNVSPRFGYELRASWSDGGRLITPYFFCSDPLQRQKIPRALLAAGYPNCEVEEAKRPFHKLRRGDRVGGFDLDLLRNWRYPIGTSFERPPMNFVAAAMLMEDDVEHILFQVLARPVPARAGRSRTLAARLRTPPATGGRTPPDNLARAEALEAKAREKHFRVAVRVLAAGRSTSVLDRLDQLADACDAFASPFNGFRARKVPRARVPELVRAMAARDMGAFAPRRLVLGASELAHLVRLPGGEGWTVPHVRWNRVKPRGQ
ncbi:MAG: hypothetical protein QXQ87_04645 [Halobacteria archaeon]